jgi:hypothetical protein
MEYWDAYLKEQPAPEWLKNGIPRLKMDEHLREQKKKLEGKKIAMRDGFCAIWTLLRFRFVE